MNKNKILNQVQDDNLNGTLYIVATPIGNFEDITLRALETLKSVDLIACEDTRHTGVLLKHFGIEKPLVSYFQHSKLAKVDWLIGQLVDGKNIALVTDAGTPGISDPGEELVYRIRNYELGIREKGERFPAPVRGDGILKQDADPVSSTGRLTSVQDDTLADWNDKADGNSTIEQYNNGIRVIPVPGPSALTAAASVSGMIEKEFFFAGFLPKKKGRQTRFKALSKLDVPIVIYESAMRLEKTLGEIKGYFGAKTEVFIAREITKMFEEYWGGNVDEVISDLKNHPVKGEIVLIAKRLAN